MITGVTMHHLQLVQLLMGKVKMIQTVFVEITLVHQKLVCNAKALTTGAIKQP